MKTNQTLDFDHATGEATGVLLVNLGTPDSPSTADVRRYLKEFLWDHRVVEMPRTLWWLVLNLVILNTRPRRSAAAYAKVWTDEGSPLLVISKQQQQALQTRLEQTHPGQFKVGLAMRYGNPSIADGLKALDEAAVRRLLILPLYPQYSATTTASIFDAVTAELSRWRWLPEVRFVNHYHDQSGYIAALAESVQSYWAQHGRPDKLILSFHGIPQDYFLAGDPYYCECQKTGRLLAAALGLSPQQWQLSFQSRLGPKQWLEPYTDQTLEQLAKEGVSRVQVLCPGFSADCLETLEEISMENRDVFLQAGGSSYGYIPCLNQDPRHIEALSDLVIQHTQGWPALRTEDELELELSERKVRALNMGAET